MVKKLLSLLFCGVFLTGLCPAAAFAEESVKTLEPGQMDFRHADTDRQGDGWYWDANGVTLTLENFQYALSESATEDAAAIYLPKDAYVQIEGDNNILETNSHRSNAFHCAGSVNFYGDGSLSIFLSDSSCHAIHVVEGPLLIDDEVEIAVETHGYLVYLENAKGDHPLISIQDKAKLRFKTKEHENNNILLIKKANTKTYSSWLSYAAERDSFDLDYTNLVAKTVQTEPTEAPSAPVEEEKTPEVNEYRIVIGDANIRKNGTISYTADVVPYLNQDGYTMLPLRALLMVSNPEQQINWNNNTKQASTFVDNKLVTVVSGEPTYTKETEKIALRTPAETVNGRLFVSLRDWMDIMEIDVSQLDWDAATKTVTLTY
ncbi:MAG: copper amine oxidase N-terminal domain-containing protein [Bacillota bacterium]|nr:copper amine oxidase N-terminal domain-containing protein [Bacillota bacterium]